MEIIELMATTSGIAYRKIQGIAGDSSFSVTLPKSLAQSMGIEKGTFVTIRPEGQRLVVERAGVQ
jgi:hypothetical protein